MFRKILIVEDIDSISYGLTALLQKNFDAEVRSTKFCDEAYLKIKRATYEKAPFDLVITDLSFNDTHREAKINTGEELIRLVKKEYPRTKIIAYSVDDKPYRIKHLFETYKVNGFVAKGRESVSDLIEAIDLLYHTAENYISPQLAYIIKEFALVIDDDDIELLKCLSVGMTQSDISEIFRVQHKKTSSTSSIEKRINRLKIHFKANNTIHLISITKDMGLI
jgi:DNA-binding NarL/FixJ family response regulator